MSPAGGLNRAAVIAAALRIVDRDGVDGLTMRALGAELGVDPMAAYHHVPNKEAVLDGVVEAVWTDIDVAVPADRPWQEQLEVAAHAIRAGLQRHPNAIPLMASRPNLSGPGLAAVDHVLGILLTAGLEPRAALQFVGAAGEFIMGHALVETSPPPPAGGPDLATAAEAAGAGSSLPHLTRAAAAVEMDDDWMDAVFAAGVAALVAGAEAQLAASTA